MLKSRSPLYRHWTNLRHRVRPVDPAWQSFETFSEQVSLPPEPKGYSIIARDSSKPLSADNYMWVPTSVQYRYFGQAVWCLCRGISLPLTRWADVFDVRCAVLSMLAVAHNSYTAAVEHQFKRAAEAGLDVQAAVKRRIAAALASIERDIPLTAIPPADMMPQTPLDRTNERRIMLNQRHKMGLS